MQAPAAKKVLENRPDASFKIKDSLNKIAQAEPAAKTQEQAEKTERISARESFDEQGITRALEQYVDTYKSDPIVSIALKSHLPVIQGEVIVLFIDNQLQMEKLKSLQIHLLNALMRLLNNGYISIDFQIFDNQSNTKEEKRLFTSGEKFEHFLKLNPAIADLKTIFGLEIE